MRPLVFMIVALACSNAAAQEQPSSWMLLLRTDTGAAFAPTTYETGNECGMLAESIERRTVYRAECIPAHYSDGQVAEYETAKKSAADAAKKRAAEIEQQRPALEAERQEILSDRKKRNKIHSMQRLKEIEAIIGPPAD